MTNDNKVIIFVSHHIVLKALGRAALKQFNNFDIDSLTRWLVDSLTRWLVDSLSLYSDKDSYFNEMSAVNCSNFLLAF